MNEKIPEQVDYLDFFEESLGLFGDSAVANGNPGGSFEYGSLKLCLADVSASSLSLMSHYVWNASLIIADYISSKKIDVKDQTVLELGAGAGLLGILSAQYGARKVCLSDYPDDIILRNLQHNIVTNLDDIQAGRCFVVGHRWGDDVGELLRCDPTESKPIQYTLIVLADCIWLSSQHFSLLTTLRRLALAADNRTKIYMACGVHTGYDCINRFIQLATSEEFGFYVQLIKNHRFGGWIEADVMKKMELDEISERNRSVLVYEMGLVTNLS